LEENKDQHHVELKAIMHWTTIAEKHRTKQPQTTKEIINYRFIPGPSHHKALLRNIFHTPNLKIEGNKVRESGNEREMWI